MERLLGSFKKDASDDICRTISLPDVGQADLGLKLHDLKLHPDLHRRPNPSNGQTPVTVSKRGAGMLALVYIDLR